MRIKNLMGVSEVRFKKLDSSTLEMSKNHLIRNFFSQRAPEGQDLTIFYFWRKNLFNKK